MLYIKIKQLEEDNEADVLAQEINMIEQLLKKQEYQISTCNQKFNQLTKKMWPGFMSI